MIVYKQYKVGDLTFTLSELETDTYQCDQYSDLELNVRVLRQMGATPINDKPEKHYCSNCMVGSSVVNVPKSECDCDCHKPEKIEPVYGMIGAVEDNDGRVTASDKMRDWMQQITEAVNSLKGEQMNKPTVTRHGLLDMQVCVPKDWTDEQVKAFADRENMCGTENGWSIRKQGDELLDGADERVECGNDKNYCHIMLDA